MGIERLNGKLESRDNGAHVYVRIGDNELLHLAVADRGVIQNDDIRPCKRNERHKPLAVGSVIRVDRELNGGRKILAWASR